VEKQDEKIPTVFISYSHDNHDHKKWVGDLASKLVAKGINVILDQWDLGFGDDIPKFMENSVTKADRVLMICTEMYVRKADEGEGGVGYEAMIVTGELVKNLGTAKFIPIIRQKIDKFLLPKSISTRLAVDLSDNQNFEEQFDLLLRELHKEPSIAKPPLGINPFAKRSKLGEKQSIINIIPIPNIIEFNHDTTLIYRTAIDIARKGDLVAWRRIVRQVKLNIADQIVDWRKKADNSNQLDEIIFNELVLDGISIYSPLFSVALAGVESGKDIFNNQISILEEILFPKEWNWSGNTRIVYFPFSVAFIYQSIHGAMGLLTNQLSLSIKLVSSKFKLLFDNQKKALYLFKEIIGWPSSLEGNSSSAWKILINLPKKWTWLNEAFGNEDDFQSAVCSYYMALSLLDFSYRISFPDEIMGGWPLIPPAFHESTKDQRRRAYSMLITDPIQVRNIWRDFGIEDEKIKASWPELMILLQKWLHSTRQWGFREDIELKDLFGDI
jgi:hypothetical protein